MLVVQMLSQLLLMIKGRLNIQTLFLHVQKWDMKIAGSAVDVVPAELGNTAGVIGASLLIES